MELGPHLHSTCGSIDTEVSFDSNIRLNLWRPNEARKVISDYIGSMDIFFTDTQDSKILVGEEDPYRALEKFLSMGPHTVVVKMGEKGAIAATSDGETATRPAFEVPVIDVIGAGDAFDAAFLCCRMKGFHLERSLEVANAAGALCVTVRGDVEAIPSFDDVQRFLAGKEHIMR